MLNHVATKVRTMREEVKKILSPEFFSKTKIEQINSKLENFPKNNPKELYTDDVYQVPMQLEG